MRKKIRLSITWAPFYASLAVISALGLFIGIFWAINEYQAYRESVDNIHVNYNQQYQSRVMEELDSVTKYIDYRRQQDALRAEDTIRERVQSAYTIASHIYRLYKDEKSIEELRDMVVEILRPIRWDDSHGYYFAGRIAEERIDLFANEPAFEGMGKNELARLAGTDFIGGIETIIREKGAGVYAYDLRKPNYPGHIYSKLAFVKYFPPFDWFIGAGMYRGTLNEPVQRDILKQLQNTTFGQGGEIFGFRFDGTIICSRDEKLLGRSVTSLRDATGKSYGDELFRAGVEGKKEGFVTYSEYRKGDGGKSRQKMSYVKAYPELQWVFGASMYMDAMEKAITDETATYQRINFRNVFMFIVLFALSVVLLLFSTYVYSLKIRKGINLFTDFFRGASDSNEKVRQDDLDFAEFEDLALLANKMVDERIKNQLLLHRDELRLDTLLTLGMMDQYSLRDKYDFVLERIVQITGSSEGYIALVNDNQTHVSLCSCVVMDEEGATQRNENTILSTTVQGGGVAGRTVLKKTAVINNNCSYTELQDVYPYEALPLRHLDVPVFNNGKIVMVAGVCGSSGAYNNLDIRQMSMLLEGMWMHVLKKCAEEEKSRLEGQIIAVSEEERSSIGRDLHDDLCSHLTGVELLSKVLHQKLEDASPHHAGQLGIIRNLIRDAIDKTRRLSHGLYPVHIVEYGLEAAIEELVVEVKNMFRIKCTLSFEELEEVVDTNVIIHLHYMIREAVFNAARHGSPQSIEILVYFGFEDFLVQIRDDGCGFSAAKNRKGLGFHTMEYRARMVGANLKIDSEDGCGTVVSISGAVS